MSINGLVGGYFIIIVPVSFAIFLYVFHFDYVDVLSVTDHNRRPTALQDRTRDSDDDDYQDRDYDVAALANNLSQAFRYGIYNNDDNEEVLVVLLAMLSNVLT